jgi:hypothetical protein
MSNHGRFAGGAAFACFMLLAQTAVVGWSSSETLVRIVLPLTIALVPFAMWPLRRFAGAWVMFVGLAANLSVILANGGLMPIERTTMEEAIGWERAAEYRAGDWIAGSKDVLVEHNGGRATALGDSIIVRVGEGGFAASPGDFVIWAGAAILGGEAAVAWGLRQRRAALEVRQYRSEGAGGGAATSQ